MDSSDRCLGRSVLFTGARICAFLSVLPASADELRFASRRDWQAWPLPGTVELTPQGALKPIAARRDINAALNAAAFGGGIRRAGSNLRDAPLVMDGDRSTGWSPHLDDPPESWNIEVDLGRGVSARRVKLIFDPEGPAPALFDLLLSTGEHAVDEVDNPIAGTVVYRQRERFKENTRYEITYELDQSFHTPIQYVRLDLLALEPNTRLVEVEVEALGDNLALGTLERGGNLEVVSMRLSPKTSFRWATPKCSLTAISLPAGLCGAPSKPSATSFRTSSSTWGPPTLSISSKSSAA